MRGESYSLIERFEAWLKPGVFYFFLVCLIFLNLLVWFWWKPFANVDLSPELTAGIKAERDRLTQLLDASCTAPELQLYRRGEIGPLPSIAESRSDAAGTPQDRLVQLLQSAAVLVSHSEGSGSGFFINPTTIVTNRHVVEGAKDDTVFVGNKTIGLFLPARIASLTRGSDVGSADFALLRLEHSPAGIKTLPIARLPDPLQNVVAVGFPGSGTRTDQNQIPSPIYTTGDVSAVQPQSTGVTLIIHTADISPGSSGGALVDRCGSVVGINTFVQSSDSKAEGRRLYALSADSLRKFLDLSQQRYTKADECQAGRRN